MVNRLMYLLDKEKVAGLDKEERYELQQLQLDHHKDIEEYTDQELLDEQTVKIDKLTGGIHQKENLLSDILRIERELVLREDV